MHIQHDQAHEFEHNMYNSTFRLSGAEQFRGHCINRVGWEAIPRNGRAIDVITPTDVSIYMCVFTW